MSSGSQNLPPSNRVRIVVASSVALTFISFWRAAAIVLNDLGSSAYYVGGIAEDAFGRTAPWFILGVMLFSFAVRAVYVESCSMFVRGGVYRVVKEALGGTLAKLSVSALMFDYILTGPISGVSAGQYIAGLINELFSKADAHGWIGPGFHAMFHGTPQVNVNATAVVICLAVTLYYWWENIKGIEESSDKALRVMQITTVMVVLLLGWAVVTLMKIGGSIPPLPTPANLHFNETSLGFLAHTSLATNFGLFGILMAFGHSVLAMSGEETLAQVNREIAHPKLKNLKRAAIIVAIYSFLFTGVGTMLAVMIIPQNVPVSSYENNLLAELVMWFSGPLFLKLLFRTFVVVVGFLILSGAINTSIIGSNGVLNRVSEDGVLTDWFRKPQKRYGTSYRIVNLIVGLQIITILLSRGDVNVLGEAYAFGVIWSFTFNSVAMLVLRFKYKGERGWKVPPNISIAGREVPLGLLSVFMVLLTTALVNLATKKIATITGLMFAAAFFAIFTISERVNARKFKHAEKEMKEHFQLLHEERIEREAVGIRPDCTLVTVRDYNTLLQLRWVLQNTDTTENDVVVLAARLTGPGSGEVDLSTEQIFSDHEQTLFTKCVSIAESYGKHISLMVVPARDVFSAIVQTANSLLAARVVAGLSTKMTAEEQAFRMGQAWEAAPPPKHQFVFQVVKPGPEVQSFRIGPHTPDLKTEDVMLVHRLWLDARRQAGTEELHHHDIVTLALTRLAADYSRDRQSILKELRSRGDGLVGKTPPRVGPTGKPLPNPVSVPPTHPRSK
ncbi:MAG: APC family permease [Acidobacteria bacterium]|nr:MAG: APC family permease [Acidobacteriota bacterium]PYY24047.1 MAG: APC family permease [Acidobacteriota bacterium]